MLLLLTQFLVLLLGILSHYFLLDRRLPTIVRGGALGFLANVLTLGVIIFWRRNLSIYQVNQPAAFYLRYLALSGFLLLVLWLGMALAYGRMQFFYSKEKWKITDLIVSALIIVFITLGGLLFFGAHWLSHFFNDITADHLVYLLQGTGGSDDSNPEEITTQLNLFVKGPVIVCALVGLAIALVRSGIVWKLGKEARPRTWSQRMVRLVALLLSLLLVLLPALAYSFGALPLANLIRSETVSSSFLEENYQRPSEKILSFPQRPRNLVHIYLESVENSYYDRAHGGYGADNLMPELGELTQENISFSHNDKFGGPYQTFGASHSVAAMINMGSGVPMKTSVTGGTAEAMSYPNLPTVGDILHHHGYRTVFMQAADADWGGLGDYYRKHGDFLIFDVKEAKKRGLIPEDYREWWGYEDDKLYEYTKNQLTELAQSDQPFYMVVENGDTHFPDGYVSKNMTETPFEQQYANVIHYSQREVVKLVRWIQEQPFGPDTTIILTGDHRSMDHKFFEGWDPEYNRTVVNVFINPLQPVPATDRTQNRLYAPFDFFPTTIAALGIEIKGDRLGLGTNLFSGRKTLIEEHGLETVDLRLSESSAFYQKSISPEALRKPSYP